VCFEQKKRGEKIPPAPKELHKLKQEQLQRKAHPGGDHTTNTHKERRRKQERKEKETN